VVTPRFFTFVQELLPEFQLRDEPAHDEAYIRLTIAELTSPSPSPSPEHCQAVG